MNAIQRAWRWLTHWRWSVEVGMLGGIVPLIWVRAWRDPKANEKPWIEVSKD